MKRIKGLPFEALPERTFRSQGPEDISQSIPKDPLDSWEHRHPIQACLLLAIGVVIGGALVLVLHANGII